MRVDLTVEGALHAWQIPEIAFGPDGLRLMAPGVDGFIPTQGAAGHLALAIGQPLEGIEYFLRVCYAVLAYKAGGLMVHGAGIVRDGRGFIFFGHSGSGKTTVARHSAEHLVLNDDLVIVLPRGETWWIYGTPFWNLDQVPPQPGSAPLAGLFRLVQAKSVYLQPMTPALALAELLANLPVLPADQNWNAALMARGLELLATCPARQLHFLPDGSFWQAVLAL
jgi:hypothetical protein